METKKVSNVQKLKNKFKSWRDSLHSKKKESKNSKNEIENSKKSEVVTSGNNLCSNKLINLETEETTNRNSIGDVTTTTVSTEVPRFQ